MEKIGKFAFYIELILIGVFLLGLTSRLLHFPLANFLLTIALLMLGCFFTMKACYLPMLVLANVIVDFKGRPMMSKLLMGVFIFIMNLQLSIFCIAVWGNILHKPWWRISFWIGLFFIVFVLIFFLVNIKNKPKKYVSGWVRSFALIGVPFLIFWLLRENI